MTHRVKTPTCPRLCCEGRLTRAEGDDYACPACGDRWPAALVAHYPGMFHKAPFAALPGFDPDTGFGAQDIPTLTEGES